VSRPLLAFSLRKCDNNIHLCNFNIPSLPQVSTDNRRRPKPFPQIATDNVAGVIALLRYHKLIEEKEIPVRPPTATVTADDIAISQKETYNRANEKLYEMFRGLALRPKNAGRHYYDDEVEVEQEIVKTTDEEEGQRETEVPSIPSVPGRGRGLGHHAPVPPRGRTADEEGQRETEVPSIPSLRGRGRGRDHQAPVPPRGRTHSTNAHHVARPRYRDVSPNTLAREEADEEGQRETEVPSIPSVPGRGRGRGHQAPVPPRRTADEEGQRETEVPSIPSVRGRGRGRGHQAPVPPRGRTQTNAHHVARPRYRDVSPNTLAREESQRSRRTHFPAEYVRLVHLTRQAPNDDAEEDEDLFLDKPNTFEPREEMRYIPN